MPDSELKERIKAVKDLLGAFRMERQVYLISTSAAVLLLLASAVQILKRGGDHAALAGVISSSGGLLYTTSRLLKMWSDALALVAEKPIGGDA